MFRMIVTTEDNTRYVYDQDVMEEGLEDWFDTIGDVFEDYTSCDIETDNISALDNAIAALDHLWVFDLTVNGVCMKW